MPLYLLYIASLLGILYRYIAAVSFSNGQSNKEVFTKDVYTFETI
jgi:hypothetical protein